MFLRACGVAALLLASAAVQAEDAKTATPAPLKPPKAAPAKPATAAATATAPATPVGATAATAPAATMSESKFLGALYAEIAKHTPEKSPAGDGEVTASFHVNATGKVDKVTIDKTSSPALAEAVKKILASVAAPPPPGGGMDVGQTFRFRALEGEK